MKLIILNWTNFELFYVLESIRNILQDSTRFKKIQEYSKSKSTSQSQRVNKSRVNGQHTELSYLVVMSCQF